MITLGFLSDRFLKWVRINFTLTPIILTPIIPIIPIIFLVTITIAGCGNGAFSDGHLFLNTEFDHKLQYEMLSNNVCFSFPPKNALDELEFKRFKSSRLRIFHELFPQETTATTVLDTLKTSGSQCRIDNKFGINLIHCSLTKELIYGIKKFHMLGWKTSTAYLIRSSFEYVITAQENHVIDVGVDVIGCELYEIDKDIYEKSKINKPVRRLK